MAAAHLCCCLLVCWFFVSPFERPIIQFLSLAQLQPGSSELGEGVILMGVLEMGTCGGRAPLLLLVGVLVFCVPIPTYHYFSS